MMRLCSIVGCGLLLVVSTLTTAKDAVAQKGRAFVKCPNFLVLDTDGTYRSIRSLAAGKSFKCSNNEGALRRLGYIPAAAGDPVVVANPELDTERVITGRGDYKLTRAFRVSTVARVVTAEVSNCATNQDGYPASIIIRRAGGIATWEAFESIVPGKPTTFTFATPDVYGVEIGHFGDGPCDFSIRIQ